HDRGDGSEGTPTDLAVHGPAVVDPPGSVGQLGQFGEVAQAGGRAGDLRVRLGLRLALFPREQPGEVVTGRFHGVGRRAQSRGPDGRVGTPVAPGPVGPVDEGVECVRLLVGGFGEGFSGGRIDDGERRGPVPGRPGGRGVLRGRGRRRSGGRRTAGGSAACSRACWSTSARKAATRCGRIRPALRSPPSQTAPRTPTMSVPMRVSEARSVRWTLPARAASRPAAWASRTNSAQASGGTWSNNRVPSLIAVSSMAASAPERDAMSGRESGLTQPIRWASA